jgi:uncharacterized protein DUF4419
MRFKVSDVKTERQSGHAESHEEHLNRLINGKLEAVSRPPRGNVLYTPAVHQFVGAVGRSFKNHFPLILSPDSVWITISQGLANHINQHAEDVRKKFVAHEGKVQIVIRRDNFIKGAKDNDWEGAFEEFSARIKEHIGPSNHEMIVGDFSTTGVVEKAASEVVLMDAMKSYFTYGCMTCCGIPDIELTGTVEDWENLQAKVQKWVFEGPANLSWWTTPLKRVLAEFLAAARGTADQKWWESFYKEGSRGGSGAVSRISGWINWLFPYMKNSRTGDDLVRNPKMGVSGLDYGDGFEEWQYPSSLSRVPFEWNYYGEVFNMELVAGVSAVIQEPLMGAVSPTIGWGVREVGKIKQSKIKW